MSIRFVLAQNLRRTIQQGLAALFVVVFAFCAPHANARAEQCSEVFKLAETLLQPFEAFTFANTVQTEEVFESYEELSHHLASRNRDFARRLADLRKSNSTLAERDYSDLVDQHHRSRFALINDSRTLEGLRESAYEQSLNVRGANGLFPQLSGRKRLEAISSANRARLAKEKKISDQYKRVKEIRELVDGFDFVMTRNAHSSKIDGGSILSSRQIESYGFSGGLNSRSPFNRNFLQSDDDVFFFIDFRNLNVKGLGADSAGQQSGQQYGSHQRRLDREYARKNAWVSPFIMYTHHMADFFGVAHSRKYTEEELGELLHDPDRTKRLFTPSETGLRLRRELHRYDFTYGDYEILVRDQLGTALLSLKNRLKNRRSESQLDYEEVVDALVSRDISPQAYKTLLIELVHGPLGLRWMELKVPVAVPETAIR